MPVQLTLRSPKGGRVLAERTYDDGYRIDASAGWLVVVDRNGSAIAAHAASPGLEGAVVEYASAEAPQSGPWSEHLIRRDPRDSDDDQPEQRLDLGEAGGSEPLDMQVARLAGWIVDNVPGEPSRSEGAIDCAIRLLGQVAETMPATPHQSCEEQADKLRAEVARLTANLDAQDQVNRRLIAEHRSEVDELRTTLDLYRRRYGPTPQQSGGPETLGEAFASAAPTITADRRRPGWVTLPGTAAHPGERHHFHDDTPHGPTGEDDEQATLTEQRDKAFAGAVAATRRAEAAERTLAAEQETTAHLRALVTSYRRQLAELEDTGPLPERPLPGLAPDPSLGEVDLRPVEEDPRRPHINAWPDDAVLLTYRELRRLCALHVEACDPTRARGLLDGEVPLRVSEVLA